MKDNIQNGKGGHTPDQPSGNLGGMVDQQALDALALGVAVMDALRDSDKKLREVIDGA